MPAVSRYSRADFTALRAFLNRLPISRIATLYYSEEDLESLNCVSETGLCHRLEALRDHLVQRASESNPQLSELLRNARRSQIWSKALITYLVSVADMDMSTPSLEDPVSMWFKPRVATLLKAEGARTLAELITLIKTRGHGWYRPIPRIGIAKAQAIVRWLRHFPKNLGEVPDASLYPMPQPAELAIIQLPGSRENLVPLERVALASNLDGSTGINRNATFCLIAAHNDLEAIDSYLYKFRGQEKTHRAYQKELERFLLWCIYKRDKPLSSVMLEDCEAYKDFLARPDPSWIGTRQPRLSAYWKPFAGIPAPSSQRYAVQALRAFFAWMVNVRYLGGNPWITVADPAVAQPLLPIQIDKALPGSLWEKLIGTDNLLDQLSRTPDTELRVRYRLRGWATQMSMSGQYRLVRAALLLLGDGGLRREEVAHATRDKLKPIPGMPDLWELAVLGKRNKWRTIFLPLRAIVALQAHWKDREQDFEFGAAPIPLISPLVVPATSSSRNKHKQERQSLPRETKGFSPDGLYQVIKTSLTRIADDECLPLDNEERKQLRFVGPHAFRHTFGTQAAANEVPLDVLQRILGHASLNTTTLYIQAEKQRSAEEIGKFFRR